MLVFYCNWHNIYNVYKIYRLLHIELVLAYLLLIQRVINLNTKHFWDEV